MDPWKLVEGAGDSEPLPSSGRGPSLPRSVRCKLMGVHRLLDVEPPRDQTALGRFYARRDSNPQPPVPEDWLPFGQLGS